ncbi:MAG: thiamine pyrophosphate-binding protein [Candidatus Aenigmarchaeota archaeon]|nr:thiamine pyrophosphate-binding protein [Candidatus Aenigmarchaeota archaeon]
MKASDHLFRELGAQGIEWVFGMLGREAGAVRPARGSCPRFVVMRDERNAGFAADAYGRLTGTPGVCMATLGPGLTNLLTGVASAWSDRSPLLAIVSQAELSAPASNAHQRVPNLRVAAPLTKGAFEAKTGREIRSLIAYALDEATRPPAGPVLVSIPIDLFSAEAPTHDAGIQRVTKADWIPQALQDAREAIMASSIPVIVTGADGLREGGAPAMQRLARNAGIGLASTYSGKGAFDERDPCFLATVNEYLEDLFRVSFSEAFQEVDLVLAVGVAPSDGVDFRRCFPRAARVIHFPPIEANNRTRGDLERALALLLNAVPENRERLRRIHALSRKIGSLIEPLRTPGQNRESLDPRSLLAGLESLPDGSVIVSDVGLYKQYLGLLLQTRAKLRFLSSNGLGAMGWGLGAAIGAACACPGERIVLVTGDGGMQIAAADLETVARLDLDIGIIVLTNQAYELIRYYHVRGWPGEAAPHIEFGAVDFAMLAEANGLVGSRPGADGRAVSGIQSFLARRGPRLLEVPVSYSPFFQRREHVRALAAASSP